MVTIVKGKEKIVCTKGLFEEQYKHLGYQIASDKKEATKQVASFEKEEKEDNQEKTLKDITKESEEENKINEKYGLKPKKGRK